MLTFMHAESIGEIRRFHIGGELEVTRCKIKRVGGLSNKWGVVLDRESLVQYLCSIRSFILRKNENPMRVHCTYVL